jgi:2-polyprenyl-6-methoxyphenol hydroxylase-like FAD-dependent oxidoreductase
MTETAQMQDVVVIGAGPVGLIAAGLLEQARHHVAPAERHPEMCNLPSAGHVDHEVGHVSARSHSP